MIKYNFRIGDLLISKENHVALISDIFQNMSGNNTICLIVYDKKEPFDLIPCAIIDEILEQQIDCGIYRYYAIII